MEQWRSEGRQERRGIDSRGRINHKRERPDDRVTGYSREKRRRSDNERKDKHKQRHQNKSYLVNRNNSRENHRKGPSSISDLNQIYDRLSADIQRDDRKKSHHVFEYMEIVRGKRINILEGLKLHTHVFDPLEQAKIVNFVFEMQRLGEKIRLKERTYTAPAKWMRGKGRVTLQFGCCYNYRKDAQGNLPGIMRDAQVDSIPPLLKDMIRRLVSRRILPKTCVPDSCIINIYEKGDCIPPHIDHKDFLRPFCTVSFLSEANILFDRNLNVTGPGEFSGSTTISLPQGSVLVLSGNGADEAQHCVPAVKSKRISITFRKMRHDKLPYHYKPDPDHKFA